MEVTDDFRNDPKKGVTGTPFIHPQCNPNILDNDVAGVVLERAFAGTSTRSSRPRGP